MKRLVAFFMSGVLIGAACASSVRYPISCSWARGAGAIAMVCR